MNDIQGQPLPPTDGRNSQASIKLMLCIAASLVEGFDIQSAGVAATRFASEFQLTSAQLGWVFSSNTFGLFVGAAMGGILSDRYGRRIVLLASMICFGIFSIGTALATEADFLILMRFLTGLGLGGAMPNIIAMTAESGGAKGSASRVTMVTAGIPLGGSLASLQAWLGGADFEWREIFWVGGILPILVGIAMMFLLTESEDYRRAKEGPDQSSKGSIGALFGDGRRAQTILLWVSFFFTLVVLYLILNWLPSLLVDKGFTRSDATLGTLLFAFGGAIGAVVLGWMMANIGWRLIVAFAYLGVAVSLFAMSLVTIDFALMLIVSFAIGFFVIGAQYLLYGLSPRLYPTEVRGKGVGWGVAIGRLGAIAGPALAATMLSMGGSGAQVLVSMMPVIGIAFLAALLLTWNLRQ